MGLFSGDAMEDKDGHLYCAACLKKISASPDKAVDKNELIGSSEAPAPPRTNPFIWVGLGLLLLLLGVWKFSGKEDKPTTPTPVAANSPTPTTSPTPVSRKKIEPILRLERIQRAFAHLADAESKYFQRHQNYADADELRRNRMLQESELTIPENDYYEIKLEIGDNTYLLIASPKSSGSDAIYYTLDHKNKYRYDVGKMPSEDTPITEFKDLPWPAQPAEQEMVEAYQKETKRLAEEEEARKKLEEEKKKAAPAAGTPTAPTVTQPK